MWQLFAVGFLDFVGGIGEYNLDLIMASTAKCHYINFERDNKRVILSLNVLAMSF